MVVIVLPRTVKPKGVKRPQPKIAHWVEERAVGNKELKQKGATNLHAEPLFSQLHRVVTPYARSQNLRPGVRAWGPG